MEFMESAEFTRRIVKLGLESELEELQTELRENPRAGMVEPGKRFGARVHYAYSPRMQTIYLIHVYTKGEQEALSPEQKKVLCRRLHAWGAE
jgi:hypothetical protein